MDTLRAISELSTAIGFLKIAYKLDPHPAITSNIEGLSWLQEEIRKQHVAAQSEAQIAKVDAAFAKLEGIEASYRKHFGPIKPITERTGKDEILGT